MDPTHSTNWVDIYIITQIHISCHSLIKLENGGIYAQVRQEFSGQEQQANNDPIHAKVAVKTFQTSKNFMENKTDFFSLI